MSDIKFKSGEMREPAFRVDSYSGLDLFKLVILNHRCRLIVSGDSLEIDRNDETIKVLFRNSMVAIIQIEPGSVECILKCIDLAGCKVKYTGIGEA